MLKGKNVLLCVSSSVAAYKAAELCSLLVKAHANVNVIMTENATKFISPITFESLTHNRTVVDTFDRNHSYEIEHIALADLSDVVMVAPATANVIAKLANGLADDMLSTTVLACNCPKIVAPAMNTKMYENPITTDNIEKLRHYGFEVIEPCSGHLACGATGKGKLPAPEDLFESIVHAISHEKDLAGKNILITAGPTRESIDPVRYITNHSTGKMGYAIAKAAAYRGANVTLVSGPVDLKKPSYVNIVDIVTAREMFEEVTARFNDMDIIIKAAAVADYRPITIADDKIKKSDDELSIKLERTDDILKFLGEHKKENQFLCGFSMETKDMLENSRKKLVKKNLHMIAANIVKVKGAGFGVETNVLTLITKDKEKQLPLMSKFDAANVLLDEIIVDYKIKLKEK